MNIDNDWLKENVNLDDYINENIKKVLIHIGFHKTATSSIQQTLYKNMGVLKKNNIYYSENRKAENAFTLFGLFCDTTMNRYDFHVERGHTQEQIDDFNQDNLLILLNEIKQCKQNIILLSEEHLSTIVNKEKISEIKNFFSKMTPKADITIICCVRNPVTYYISDFQQRVAGNLVTIPKNNEYRNCKLQYFEYRISGYIDIFGKKNIIIYKFEDACKNEYGPVGYFLYNILKLKHKIIDKMNIVRTNEGRSQKALEIISYCNEKIPYFVNGRKSDNRDFGDTHPLARIRGEKFSISIDVQKKIYKNMLDDIIWLKQNFMIDYEDQSFKHENNKETYGRAFYIDIINVFPRLTETIKNLVFKYISEKTAEVDDDESIKWLSKLIAILNEYIGTNRPLLIKIDDNYKWFLDALNSEKSKGIPQIYRDIAMFCELHGEIDTAKTFMGIAKDYAPNGTIINSKYDEYVKILGNKEKVKKIYIK